MFEVFQMKLSVLLLSALLALSSAGLRDAEEKSPQPEEVPHLNPDLEEILPEITANGSLLALLTPPELEKKKTCQSLSFPFRGSSLKWQTSYGSILSGAVKVYNSYAKRYDYVCKFGCSAGFFNPGMGPRCRYPSAEHERLGYPFQMLVNKDDFEILEWRDESWGGVPQHPVKTCVGENVYVGRNEYGLGKVQVRHKALFLPWEGREYWYKKYQILTISRDFYSEHMYNVRYNTKVKVTERPPEDMHRSTITNSKCRPAEKTLTLSRTVQEEQRWDSSAATKSRISSITAQIPSAGSSGLSLSKQTTKQFTSGTSIIKSTTYSVSVRHTVPPNSSCRVSMVGRRYKADVPFTALLRRTYRDGRTTVASISGTFSSVTVEGIHSVVDHCRPLPDARPCT